MLKFIELHVISLKIFLSIWVWSRDLTTRKCYHIIITWKMKCESWKAMKCVSENNSHPKFSEFYDHHNRLHCIVLTREDSFIMMWDEWWAQNGSSSSRISFVSCSYTICPLQHLKYTIKRVELHTYIMVCLAVYCKLYIIIILICSWHKLIQKKFEVLLNVCSMHTINRRWEKCTKCSSCNAI